MKPSDSPTGWGRFVSSKAPWHYLLAEREDDWRSARAKEMDRIGGRSTRLRVAKKAPELKRIRERLQPEPRRSCIQLMYDLLSALHCNFSENPMQAHFSIHSAMRTSPALIALPHACRAQPAPHQARPELQLQAAVPGGEPPVSYAL